MTVGISSADPNGGAQTLVPIEFTGFNINNTAGSRTVFNANIARGMVLQFDPNASQTNGSGTVQARGERVGTPTASTLYNFAIVDEIPNPRVNDVVGVDSAGATAANLRRGGQLRGIVAGNVVRALVAQSGGGALSPGQALAPGTAAVLVSTDQSAPTARVGATARAYAVLLETVAQGSGNVLADVQIIH